MSYGIEIYGTARKHILNKLQGYQNRIIRILFNNRSTIPQKDIYKKLKLMQVNEIYKYNLAILGYNLFNNKVPKLIADLFTKREKIITRDTRQRGNINISYVKTNFANRDINNQVALIWNKIKFESKDVNQKRFRDIVKSMILKNCL